MFSLIPYKVEADFVPGLSTIIRAESYWDAILEASRLWDIPAKHITASLACTSTITSK